ncbi:MAG TPA: hypothetical protein DHW15_09755 [Bacteroidetes bacterium]|jgi:uncharacterized damage-inducible protein DinB|nr:MAG: hypothetical protein ABR94_05895 [Sphingobacteriales bacterium BACL12 MAG-120802-bin5]KRP12697.1 MAG: hypothetical protein ABR95_11555 [Sphingobacteriales bacterium BACL12 MAG-120813-bin55]HCK22426.1 hypothetical protein [Bacteroidota bacterium]
MIKDYLISLSRYNLWANTAIVNMVNSQSFDAVNTPVTNSFDTIGKTLFHIWDAQVIWLERLKGSHPTDWPSKQYNAALAGFETYFIQQSSAMVEQVIAWENTFYQQSTSYKNLKGETFETNNADILLHCFNHSTYHRGQIVTCMRQLGAVNITSTDYITFKRNDNIPY